MKPTAMSTRAIKREMWLLLFDTYHQPSLPIWPSPRAFFIFPLICLFLVVMLFLNLLKLYAITMIKEFSKIHWKSGSIILLIMTILYSCSPEETSIPIIDLSNHSGERVLHFDELVKDIDYSRVLIIGGGTLNTVLLNVLRDRYKKPHSPYVPDNAAVFEAYGAAVWALDNDCLPLPESIDDIVAENCQSFSFLPALHESSHLVEFREPEPAETAAAATEESAHRGGGAVGFHVAGCVRDYADCGPCARGGARDASLALYRNAGSLRGGGVAGDLYDFRNAGYRSGHAGEQDRRDRSGISGGDLR